MLSANNLLAPKDGKPITVPTQDMVLGSYYLTLVKPKEVKITDMQTQEEAERKKDRPMKQYRYTIINSFGKKEVGTFDAEEEQDVRSYLLSQDYKVLEVKERSKYDIDINIGNKLSADDLSFSLTQLSTYIRSGIPLVDGVKILAKQENRL